MLTHRTIFILAMVFSAGASSRRRKFLVRQAVDISHKLGAVCHASPPSSHACGLRAVLSCTTKSHVHRLFFVCFFLLVSYIIILAGNKTRSKILLLSIDGCQLSVTRYHRCRLPTVCQLLGYLCNCCQPSTVDRRLVG